MILPPYKQTELKKSYKVTIALSERDEWQTFFENAKTEHQAFNIKITALEWALNQAVYQLFHLTPEDIQLIETA